MVTIPADVARRYGILPGYRLDWRPGSEDDEILVRVIPDRSELGRRLRGSGRRYAPEQDAVAGLIAEREADG